MFVGALVEGEKLLLGGGWLYFRDVAFYDPDCSKQIKPPLGEGRICLTNLRMLLLCAETASGRPYLHIFNKYFNIKTNNTRYYYYYF